MSEIVLWLFFTQDYERQYIDKGGNLMEDEYRSHKKYGKYSQEKSGGVLGKILAVLATLAAAVLVFFVFRVNVLPVKYMAVVLGALVLMLLLAWIFVCLRPLPARLLGSLLSLAILAASCAGVDYINSTMKTLAVITNEAQETQAAEISGETGEASEENEAEDAAETAKKVMLQTEEVSVVVLSGKTREDLERETAESEEGEEDEEETTAAAETAPAIDVITSVKELSGKKIGIQTVMLPEVTEKAVEQLKSEIGGDCETVDYAGMLDLVQALYDKEVDAILLSESYRELVKDEHEDFDIETAVIETMKFDFEIDMSKREKVDKNVTAEPFIVYLSGIDTFGSVAARSRSDVNILAVINPTTRQIMLVTTPRDYYVQLPVAGNAYDKLTHAGIYGIDASIETLEQLYDINIDYYLRVNFTGFMDIVDALGGVDVNSDQAFTGEVYGVHFDEGINHVDGMGALSFVRERHSFANGDFERQRHQMEMIRAIINKMHSPEMLLRYSDLMASLQESFNTDLASTDLTDLVKMELDSSTDWNIKSYGVSGQGARRSTYSMGSRSLYVALQDEASIQGAKERIQKVFDGEILTDADSQEGNQTNTLR